MQFNFVCASNFGLIACVQAALRSIAMLLAWAPTQFCSAFFSTAGALALGSQGRIRFVHKLLLQYSARRRRRSLRGHQTWSPLPIDSLQRNAASSSRACGLF